MGISGCGIIQKPKSEGCTRGVLRAPPLAGREDPDPPLWVSQDIPIKKTKVSQKKGQSAAIKRQNRKIKGLEIRHPYKEKEVRKQY